MTGYLYIAQLAIPPEFEAEFNELYDSGYVPALLAVPGVTSAARYRLEWTDGASMPEYMAVYEMDDPQIPKSEAWRKASVACGWAERIRPHLTVRRHGMYRRLSQT